MNISVKQKPLEIFIHVIVWILVFGFPTVFIDRGSNFSLTKFFTHSIFTVGYFIVFYINYLYLIPQLLLKDKINYFLILNTILVMVATLSVHFFWNQCTTPPPGRFMGPPPYYFYLRDFIMMIFVVGLSVAVRLSMRWRILNERLIVSEKQKTDAELKNLKNQLNPHFLLNTLNNIYALTTFNTEKAQNAIMELSHLLRYMLYENQTDVVPLQKEFNFIKDYVSLMRIRLTDDVKVEMNLTEEPGSNISIAPFLYISLIENAFKHGVSPTENSFITISILGKTDGKVECHIRNSNYPKSESDKSGSGIGLEQVQKRLDLMYHGRYQWEKEIKDNVYSSTLIIFTK